MSSPGWSPPPPGPAVQRGGRRGSLPTSRPSQASSRIPRGRLPAVRTGRPGRVVSPHALPQCPSAPDGSEVVPRWAQDKAQRNPAPSMPSLDQVPALEPHLHLSRSLAPTPPALTASRGPGQQGRWLQTAPQKAPDLWPPTRPPSALRPHLASGLLWAASAPSWAGAPTRPHPLRPCWPLAPLDTLHNTAQEGRDRPSGV